MLDPLSVPHLVVFLLICRTILCQPTVFTKQWYKDTNCITDENDILTTLEFILVDLQRLRFDTKQLKDDSTLIKTNFVRMKEDVNHIKTQNKKFIVTLNKFGNKLDITEVNKADVKDVLLELNKTVVRILNPMSCGITTMAPNLSSDINNAPAISHKNEIPNEIIVVEQAVNDNIYIENAENEIENNIIRLSGALENNLKTVVDEINVIGDKVIDQLYDRDREYDIEIESFSGEGYGNNNGYAGSGFGEEEPENTAFQSDQFNSTFETNATRETVASYSPKLNEIGNPVDIGDNRLSAEAKGSDLFKLGDAESGQDVFTGRNICVKCSIFSSCMEPYKYNIYLSLSIRPFLAATVIISYLIMQLCIELVYCLFKANDINKTNTSSSNGNDRSPESQQVKSSKYFE